MALRLSTGLRNKLMGIKTNLVSNGAFGADTSGWTGDGATLAAVSGVLEITNSGSAAGSAYTDITTRIGTVYKLSFDVDIGTGTTVQVQVGTTADPDANLTSPSYSDATLTGKELVFIATATTTRITFVNESTTSGHLIQVDNVVAEEILDGFGEIMRNAKIAIFSGSQPTNAADASAGTLLITVGKNLDSGSGAVDGVTWDESVAGVVSKPAGDTWSGKAVATGNAGWFRVYQEGDDPTQASSTMARFDGSVATSGGEMTVTAVAMAADSIQTIGAFTLTQPAS